MGAWGPEPFANDNAMDWVWELEKSSDLGVLKSALEAEPGDLDADVGVELVAAAAVVAGLDLSEEARSWRERHAQLDFASLKPLARQALARVKAEGSELRELWEEVQPQAWLASLERLETALR